MTKAQEIEWLDRAIAELGTDTYIGATLSDQRNAIVADIRNDIGPLKLTWLYNEQMKEREAHRAIEKTTIEARARLIGIEGNIDLATHRFNRVKEELGKGIEALRSVAAFAERSVKTIS